LAPFPKLYTEFAKYYDRLENQYRDYPREAQWLEKVLEKHRSGRIVDVSCGTASHLSNLLFRSKLEAFALDASSEMIRLASNKIKNRGARCEFLLSDFLAIPFKRDSFEAAICMYWSLAGLDQEGARTLFRQINYILVKEGLFVFDVENAEGIKENLLNELFIDNFFSGDEEESVVIRANLSKKISEEVVDWHAYYLIEREGVSELVNDSMKLRFYSKNKLESLLSETGFRVLGVYSGPFKQYASGSPSLYFVAEKL
jgi:SAM-dependent methyltransferase